MGWTESTIITMFADLATLVAVVWNTDSLKYKWLVNCANLLRTRPMLADTIGDWARSILELNNKLKIMAGAHELQILKVLGFLGDLVVSMLLPHQASLNNWPSFIKILTTLGKSIMDAQAGSLPLAPKTEGGNAMFGKSGQGRGKGFYGCRGGRGSGKAWQGSRRFQCYGCGGFGHIWGSKDCPMVSGPASTAAFTSTPMSTSSRPVYQKFGSQDDAYAWFIGECETDEDGNVYQFGLDDELNGDQYLCFFSGKVQPIMFLCSILGRPFSALADSGANISLGRKEIFHRVDLVELLGLKL